MKTELEIIIALEYRLIEVRRKIAGLGDMSAMVRQLKYYFKDAPSLDVKVSESVESVTEKSLRHFNEYFENTPKEEIQKTIDEIDEKYGSEGFSESNNVKKSEAEKVAKMALLKAGAITKF